MVTRLSIVGSAVVLPLEDSLLEAVGVTRDAEFEVSVEAVANSLLRAERMTGNGVTVEALPVERVRALVSRR